MLRDALIGALARGEAGTAEGGLGIPPRPLVQLFLEWPELPLYVTRIERDGTLLPIRVDFIGFSSSRYFSEAYFVFAKGEHADCPLRPGDPSQSLSECHRRVWLPTTRER